MTNQMLTKAQSINVLSDYLGIHDLPSLTQASLQAQYRFKQADLCILYGGSIIAGGDVLAEAIKNQLAKYFIISGGNGHTTHFLRSEMARVLPGTNLDNLSEAEMFQLYMQRKYQLQADFLETDSTNCGNNVTNVLALAKAHHLPTDKLIVIQDATMQRRMQAVLLKESPQSQIINYASYQNHVKVQHDQLVFTNHPAGMWTFTHFLQLLMGEIPRLTDDHNGYGPRGKNYLAHVEVPRTVQNAFNYLKNINPAAVREANPAFATKKN